MSLTITETNNIVVGNQIVILVRYSEVNRDNTVATQIANNTVQTWQQDRGQQETLANTIQGKVAEELLELYLSEHFPEISILSYDKIRNDVDFEKHAPFDFLTWNEECNIEGIVGAIRQDITNSQTYVRLSQHSINLCQSENVKILEVKSTKIAGRHKSQCLFGQGDYNNISKVTKLSEVILNDDFLTYPHFCRRTSNNNYCTNDYIRLLQSKHIDVNSEEEMRQFEISQQLADVFVRVYLDEAEHIGLLVGWIDKHSFYQNAVIKRMPQYGKSELALYFATSLRNGNNLDCFPTLFII